MNVLVTGGTGFIGSHATIALLKKDHDVTIVDNLSNSKIDTLRAIENVSLKKVRFIELDLLDIKALDCLFKKNKFDIVIHFAGSKSVNESIEKPLKYYFNNVYSSIILSQIMKKYDVKKIIFSSSATVYGEPADIPLKESSKVSILNPYAASKYYIENYFREYQKQNKDWKIILLRYFNPIGAHESGLIGESPKVPHNNLMPYILKVASKESEYLQVFGDDYDTEDGTGVRDFIHIMDLAEAHVSSLDFISSNQGPDGFCNIFNIGTGKGYSVLEIIETFSKVNNIEIPYKIVDRRPGDVSQSYTDVSLAKKSLNWKAKKDLSDMCRDVWRWKSSQLKKNN